MACLCEVTKLKSDRSIMHYKMFKRSTELTRHKEYLLCQFSRPSHVWFNFGGYSTESKGIFELEEGTVSAVGKQISCMQIFRELNTLPAACIYIHEILCYM
jgi:hypothetical protein